MKMLVVDVGNTSTAIGRWTNGRVTQVAHVDGDIGAAMKAAEVRLKGVEVLAYVSVVPKKDAAWRRWAKSHALAFRPITSSLLLPPSPFRLSFDYPHPETIGADRIADAVGALERYGAPVIVMDFGTALTAAVITKDCVWRGGVIAPGFPLMRDYLFERTAKLPRMKLGSGKAPKIGRSTEEAMRFGALVGYRGMVREIVATLKNNFKTDFKLVATGGFARWVLNDLDLDFIIDPTLTLYGAGRIGSLRLDDGNDKIITL